MKLFLLDTNILVGYIRAARYAAYVEKKYNLFNPENISVISVVTVAEIKSLAYKFNWGQKKIEAMNTLIKKIPSVKIDSEQILDAFAIIDSFSQGKHPSIKLPVGLSARNMQDNDIWIASTANVLKATLISTDKDFEHLKNHFIDFVYIDQSLKESDA
jgi:predicted nucleic acid-binding protein